MFVVAGVSGNTGSVVASTLLEAGREVRVLVRSAEKGARWAAQGAEVFVGSIDDPAQLAAALSGAQGAYLLSPPDLTASDPVRERLLYLERIAQGVRRGKPGHLVFLSSVGAQHPEGTGPIAAMHPGEKLFAATSVPCTFVRAAYFVENWGVVLPIAKQDGVLPSFIAKNQTIPMVSTKDIGETAAKVLLEGPSSAGVVELAGPLDVTPSDIAAAASRLLGTPVQVAEAPLEAVVPTLMSFGFSEAVATLYRELYEGIRNGKVAWQGSPARFVRGRVGIDDALGRLLGS